MTILSSSDISSEIGVLLSKLWSPCNLNIQGFPSVLYYRSPWDSHVWFMRVLGPISRVPYCICLKLSMALFFVASICVQLALTATFYRIIQKVESRKCWYYLNCLIHCTCNCGSKSLLASVAICPWPGVLTKYCLMFSCFAIMYNGFFADSYRARDVKNKSKDRVHTQNVTCIYPRCNANAGTRMFPLAIPVSSIRKLPS